MTRAMELREQTALVSIKYPVTPAAQSTLLGVRSLQISILHQYQSSESKQYKELLNGYDRVSWFRKKLQEYCWQKMVNLGWGFLEILRVLRAFVVNAVIACG